MQLQYFLNPCIILKHETSYHEIGGTMNLITLQYTFKSDVITGLFVVCDVIDLFGGSFGMLPPFVLNLPFMRVYCCFVSSINCKFLVVIFFATGFHVSCFVSLLAFMQYLALLLCLAFYQSFHILCDTTLIGSLNIAVKQFLKF